MENGLTNQHWKYSWSSNLFMQCVCQDSANMIQKQDRRKTYSIGIQSRHVEMQQLLCRSFIYNVVSQQHIVYFISIHTQCATYRRNIPYNNVLPCITTKEQQREGLWINDSFTGTKSRLTRNVPHKVFLGPFHKVNFTNLTRFNYLKSLQCVCFCKSYRNTYILRSTELQDEHTIHLFTAADKNKKQKQVETIAHSHCIWFQQCKKKRFPVTDSNTFWLDCYFL